MARKELPMLSALVVAFSGNEKLGGMAATYRPVGTAEHGGSCPSDCQFLPARLGGVRPYTTNSLRESNALNYLSRVPDIMTVADQQTDNEKVMCYAMTGYCRKHQARSGEPENFGSLFNIGRGLDVRLMVSGDWLGAGGAWDTGHHEAVVSWLPSQLGCVFGYTHTGHGHGLKKYGAELVGAGMALWVSRDTALDAIAEMDAISAYKRAGRPYAVGVTLAQPLRLLRDSKRVLESAGYSVQYCPWDLSRAKTGKNPSGLISCRDCRLCLDHPKRPDVVLFPVHGTGTEGGL